jgi:Flp pilus assembly pilin Flp
MFRQLHKRKAQSTLEYALVIAVIVAALVAMQTYIKRSLQGKLKSASDDIGDQFSPGYTTENRDTATTVTSTETVSGGVYGGTPATDVATHTDSTSTQSQSASTTAHVDVFDNEFWVE